MNKPIQYVINDQGEKTGVIINLIDYERLMEDLHDLAAVAERREEKTMPVSASSLLYTAHSVTRIADSSGLRPRKR